MTRETINIVLSFIIVLFLLYFIYRIYKDGKTLLQWARESLESDGKASARKLSALWTMVLVTFAHIAWLKNAFLQNNFSLLEGVLTIDLSFIAICLGLKTAETVFAKKYEKKDTNVG